MKPLKKIFVLFLAFVYSIASSGMLLSEHYCGGEYVDSQIEWVAGVTNAELCGSCGMEAEEDNACCESKTQHLKKTIDQQSDYHQVWNFVTWVSVLPTEIAIYYTPAPDSYLSEQSVLYQLQKPPPKTLPIFKEICCYRI